MSAPASTRVSGYDFGRALCEKFGFDPSNISTLSIEVAPGGMVKVVATKIVGNTEMYDALKEFQAVKLEEIAR